MTAKELKQEVLERLKILYPHISNHEINLLWDFMTDYFKIFCMKQKEICYSEAILIFNDKAVNGDNLTKLSDDLRNILNAKLPNFNAED